MDHSRIRICGILPGFPRRAYRAGASLIELMEMFPTDESGTEWFESVVWAGGQCCGHSGSVYKREVQRAKQMNTINQIHVALTTIIGFIALFIAYQQWRTNRRRLKLDLYDRRLRLYQVVIKYISVVKTDFRPKLRDLIEFRISTAEADFLFGPDIRAYLNELSKHGVQLHEWAEKNNREYMQSMPSDNDRRRVIDGMQREEDWFIDQGEKALQHFKSYLNLAERSRK